MKNIDQWLDEYGESHKNKTNKIIHWVCVPSIMFSLLGLLWSIPFPLDISPYLNWASIFIAAALVFYIRLSLAMFFGFLLIGGVMLYGNHLIAQTGAKIWLVSIIIFSVAWVGQFIGHEIEGKKPSFLKDLQFLLIGPAWLLHFIFKKIGIPY